MRQIKIQERITDRRELSVDKYISDLTGRQFDKLTSEQETECAKLIKEGDQKALDKLVKANLRFVVSVAKQYDHLAPLMDLINEGNIGMITAAQRFDHTRGFKFISYAVWWVRQCILKYLNENGRLVKIPLNKIQALSNLTQIQDKLKQSLEREPTQDEIEELFVETPYAKRYGAKDINNLMNLNKANLSLDYNMSNSSDGGEFTLLDVLSSENEQEEPMFLNSVQIEINRYLCHLKHVEREILEMYYGLNNKKPHSLFQIAHHLDLSSERIRHIKARAERRLKVGLNSKTILRQYL